MFAVIVTTFTRRFKGDWRRAGRCDAKKRNCGNRERRPCHCDRFISLCHCGVESKRGRIRRMKHWQTTLVILAALSASIALADDFKTIDGKEYKNVTVKRVEPDGIVLSSKLGISKVYFTELPKEVQQRFNYEPASVAAQSSQPNANATATFGIEGLSPITVEFKNEILNALKMTDKLDALYKRGCSSAEFIAAATPVESVFINLYKQLPKGDPRRDLLANTFEAYQQTAFAIKDYEQGRGQRPDVLIATAGLRKGMLTSVLEGNMTPNERHLYQVWLQGHP
jgi:hypothetical protein